jgi:hypothetical protein
VSLVKRRVFETHNRDAVIQTAVEFYSENYLVDSCNPPSGNFTICPFDCSYPDSQRIRYTINVSAKPPTGNVELAVSMGHVPPHKEDEINSLFNAVAEKISPKNPPKP